MNETQKLAEFLRTRCLRGLYGLRFIDVEQTILYIPWANVPRPNEELPAEFEMFREWTALSFRRRGNGKALAELKEPPTGQKHRFRNALNRANGLIARPDINIEGGRVFQFVEKKKSSSQGNKNSSSSNVQRPSTTTPSLQEVFTCAATPQQFHPIEATGMTVRTVVQQQHVVEQTANISNNSINYIDDRSHMMIDELFQELSPTDFPMHAQTQQLPSQMTLPPCKMMLAPNQTQLLPKQSTPFVDYHVQQNQRENFCMEVSNSPTNTYTNECFLTLKVKFRNLESSGFNVTNSTGCRIYFGNNIHDISSLLEPGHLHDILKPFKRTQDELFGPDSLHQIRLPDPSQLMRSSTQMNKTTEILNNMDRGLLLWMDWKNADLFKGIPDVNALRLCQTRVFPFGNFYVPANCQPGSLKRLQPVCMFSAETFCNQLEEYRTDKSRPSPTTSFSFALGQAVDERMSDLSNVLVSCSFTVERARRVIDEALDTDGVCISDMSSSDQEARWLEHTLRKSCRIDSF